MRIALNHGNRVLVARDAEGAPKGISVDLAYALADWLKLDLKFIEYERAVDVSMTAEKDEWDVCFLAVDPERAKTISFTEPYVRIEGCYLAGAHCQAAGTEELVLSGARVGTVQGSAYTLTLQRRAGSENLVYFEDIFAALAALDKSEVHALAGIRQAMQVEADRRPGSRVLFPPFMEIRQAMAMPQGRPEASTILSEFLAEMARSGKVGSILGVHGVDPACAIVPD